MRGFYSGMLFVYENIALLIPDGYFRDKAYPKIRCEAKEATGATGEVCSRKGIPV